jgi:hypothetical protein
MELLDKTSEQQQLRNAEKKEYKAPELLMYGTISELTNNITDTMATMDNPSHKT